MTEKLQKILCFLKNHREFLFEKTKIMLVVSFFLLGVFACAEMYSAVLLSHRIMIDRGIEAKFPSREFFKELRKNIDYSSFTTFDENYRYEEDDSPMGHEIKYRKPVGLNYNKRPIIFFGCSCTFGLGVEKDKTLPAKVSEYSHRPVYNFSLSGWGIQHVLWVLNNEKKLDEIKNPEYAIYVFIVDHYRRAMSSFPYAEVPMSLTLYSEKNGKFVKENPYRKIYYRSYFYRLLSEKIGFWKSKMPVFHAYKEDKIVSFLREENRILKQKYSDIKFVVFVMTVETDETSLEKKIENAGITVVDGRKIFDEKTNGEQYDGNKWEQPDGHPNEELFSLFASELVKKLDL